MMFYFAAKSMAKLEHVCEGLRFAYDLPDFHLDSHDTWRYGWSSRNGLGLNVTKARGYRTVETWIPGCPTGVNYQLIVTAPQEPSDFVSTAGNLLGAEIVRYYEREEPVA